MSRVRPYTALHSQDLRMKNRKPKAAVRRQSSICASVSCLSVLDAGNMRDLISEHKFYTVISHSKAKILGFSASQFHYMMVLQWVMKRHQFTNCLCNHSSRILGYAFQFFVG